MFFACHFKARVLGSTPSRLTINQQVTHFGLSNESPLDSHWTLSLSPHNASGAQFSYRSIEKSIYHYLSNVSFQALLIVERPSARWSNTSYSRPVNAISSTALQPLWP
jgi:hypothetical protein